MGKESFTYLTQEDILKYKEDILKYKFVPKIEIRREDSRKVFLCDSEVGLKLGILGQVTDGLGYDKIRKSRKTNITSEELQAHLNEMDSRVRNYHERRMHCVIKDLIDDTDFYIWYILDTGNYVKEKCKDITNGIDKLIDSYKNQLKEKDAEIERLNKKLSKKSLVNRIFNLQASD